MLFGNAGVMAGQLGRGLFGPAHSTEDLRVRLSKRCTDTGGDLDHDAAMPRGALVKSFSLPGSWVRTAVMRAWGAAGSRNSSPPAACLDPVDVRSPLKLTFSPLL